MDPSDWQETEDDLASLFPGDESLSNGNHGGFSDRNWTGTIGALMRTVGRGAKALRWALAPARVKTFLLYFVIATGLTFLCCLSSSICYAIVYRLYLPIMRHEFPVFFNFDHDHPVAEVALDRSFMRSGVAYDFVLDLDIPDVPGLPELLGNFMVTLELYASGSGSKPVVSLARPALLPYRSRGLRFALMAVKMVPLMAGWSQEVLHQRIFLAESLTEPLITKGPRKIVVYLGKRDIPIYRAKLLVVAHLSGLRYYLYFWFFTAAFFGIFSLTLVQVWCCLAAYLIYSRWVGDRKDITRNGAMAALPDDKNANKHQSRNGAASLRKPRLGRNSPPATGLRHRRARSLDVARPVFSTIIHEPLE